MAISADGKVGLAGRKPVALSGEAARARVFQLRAQSDAILVGVGTVLSDNPQLTCRLPGMLERSPVRVVLDARLRVPLATSVIATVRETPTWVFGGRSASPLAEEILQDKGCKVFRVDDADGKVDLDGVLKRLAEEGITRVMVEGGPMVAASFVAADLVDEAALIYSEKLIGEGGIAPLEGMALDALNGRLRAARQRASRARYARALRADSVMVGALSICVPRAHRGAVRCRTGVQLFCKQAG